MQSLLVTMAQLRKLIPLIALPIVFVLAACGSDGSSSTSASTTSPGSSQPHAASAPDSGGGGKPGSESAGGQRQQSGHNDSSPAPEAAFEPRTHHDSGGGSKQFESKGGDNSIQEYGSEPSSSEFAAAARSLHNYLDARALRAWGAACEYLSPAVAEELATQLGSAAGDGQPTCASVLGGLAAAALREGAQADVLALRVDGDRGFVLFRGAHGEALFIPMAREDGQWKVAAVAPSTLP